MNPIFQTLPTWTFGNVRYDMSKFVYIRRVTANQYEIKFVGEALITATKAECQEIIDKVA